MLLGLGREQISLEKDIYLHVLLKGIENSWNSFTFALMMKRACIFRKHPWRPIDSEKQRATNCFFQKCFCLVAYGLNLILSLNILRFINLFDKSSLATYCEPGTLVGMEDIVVNKMP
jgi:hypothetical protein